MDRSLPEPIHDPLQPFLDQLAAGTATPGGGGAAAATGAMGAALVSMTCNLAIGRPRYADDEADLRAILMRAEALRAELTELVSADAAAFGAVMAAYALPKESPKESTARTQAIQRGFARATQTSLATARACAAVIQLCTSVVDLGNPNAAGDVAAAAACAQAGLQTADLNARINLVSLDDGTLIAATLSALAALSPALADGDALRQRVYARQEVGLTEKMRPRGA